MSEDNLQFLYKHLLQKRHTDGKLNRECKSDRQKILSVRELWNKFDFASLKSSKLRQKVSNPNSNSMQTSSSAASFSKYITKEYSKLFIESKRSFENIKKKKSPTNQNMKEFIKTEATSRKKDRTSISHSFSDKYNDPLINAGKLVKNKTIQDIFSGKKTRGKLSTDFSKGRVPHFTPNKSGDLRLLEIKSPSKFNTFRTDNIELVSSLIQNETKKEEIQFYKDELNLLYRRTEEIFDKFVSREEDYTKEISQMKAENLSLKSQLQQLRGSTYEKCHPDKH